MNNIQATPAESALLQVLWKKGDATIRQLADILYPEGTHAHYATVQKLLERLESRGMVRRDRGPRAHRFSPTVSREEFLGGRLHQLAEEFSDGSLPPLLTALVRSGRLSAEDRRRLRQLLDELTQEPDSTGRHQK